MLGRKVVTMVLQIRKRNGAVVPFDEQKIIFALHHANMEVLPDERCSSEGIAKIIKKIKAMNEDILAVEEVQDFIENALMNEGLNRLAKKYIIYRYNHSLIRQANTTDASILSLVNNKNKDVSEENSNKNAVLVSTQRDLIAGEVSKDLTKRVLLPERIVNAHEEGVLHFHDMDYFLQPLFNCCLVNISDILDNGTVMNGKLIESPKSFQVACTVTTQVIASIASAQYGGQSIDVSHLAKYIRKSMFKHAEKLRHAFPELDNDKITQIARLQTKEEIKAGVQTIQYQINTLMTTNGQSPFVTLFLNPCKEFEYEEENVLLVEEILRQRIQGIKNEKGVYITPAFPKLIYVLDEENC